MLDTDQCIPSTTARSTVKDAVCAPPDFESVAVTVYAICPCSAVGVPLITPVAVSSERPAGSVGLTA